MYDKNGVDLEVQDFVAVTFLDENGENQVEVGLIEELYENTALVNCGDRIHITYNKIIFVSN